MLLFLDTEFTGLHQKTTLISIALYHNDETYFYAEFNDYDKSQLFSWLEENVIPKLHYNHTETFFSQEGNKISMKGDCIKIKEKLTDWIKQFDVVEIWADVLAYDWVLFCNLFAEALNIPDNIFYIPFDLSTLFRVNGLIIPKNQYENDLDRFEFLGLMSENQHNALTDARIEKMCYDKLMKI